MVGDEADRLRMQMPRTLAVPFAKEPLFCPRFPADLGLFLSSLSPRGRRALF